jgi:DNA repair exonuclease SbcCD ATPase subunit
VSLGAGRLLLRARGSRIPKMSSSESVSSVSEASNLLRLNGILQNRVDDLTDKLRIALQAQKDHLIELEQSQSAWRNDYLKMEEKYNSSCKENDQLRAMLTDQSAQLLMLKENNATLSKRISSSTSEASDTSSQLVFVKQQYQELCKKFDEKERTFMLLKNQFDIIGKEFVELKSFSSSEREEHMRLASNITLENDSLKETLKRYEAKFSLSHSTQQELNNLLHSLQTKLKSVEETATAESLRFREEISRLIKENTGFEQQLVTSANAEKQLHQQIAQLQGENTRNGEVIDRSRRSEVAWTEDRKKLEAVLESSLSKQRTDSSQLAVLQSENMQLAADLSDCSRRLTTALQKLEESEISKSSLMQQLRDSELHQRQLTDENSAQLKLTGEKMHEVCNRNATLQAEVTATKNAVIAAENAAKSSQVLLSKATADVENYRNQLQAVSVRQQV